MIFLVIKLISYIVEKSLYNLKIKNLTKTSISFEYFPFSHNFKKNWLRHMLKWRYFRGKDQRGEDKPIQASIVALRQRFPRQFARYIDIQELIIPSISR